MTVGDVLQILPSGLAGYAPAPAPAGAPTFLSVTHTCLAGAPGPAVNFDFDFSALQLDGAFYVRTRIVGTTKGGTAHLTGAVGIPAEMCLETRNGVVQLQASATGGYKNIFQPNPDEIPVAPAGNDPTLASGGFANMSAAWSFPGGGIARMIVQNQNAVNDADVKVTLEIFQKAAP